MGSSGLGGHPKPAIIDLCINNAIHLRPSRGGRPVRKLGPWLRGLTVVEVEHAAKPFTARYETCRDHLLWHDECVTQTLVGPFHMVMAHELSDGSPEVSLAERDDSLQALGLRGENEPFCIGIEVGAVGGQEQRLHTAVAQETAERRGVERVPVENEVLNAVEEAVAGVGQVPCDLRHPRPVRTTRVPAISTVRVLSLMTKKTK